MKAGRSGPFWTRALPTSGGGHRVTTFELFFDLVFVLAFTQISGLLVETHDGFGLVQAVVVLGLLWRLWVAYSWLANQSPADNGILQGGMAVSMGVIFVATLAIPEAFEDRPGGLYGPLVLVVAYTVVRLVHTGLYVLASGTDSGLRGQVLRTQAIATFPAVGLLFVGVALGGPWQTWIWLAALAWEMLLTWLTSYRGEWRLPSAGHWAERYGLVVILALGESVVDVGVGASRLPVSTPVIVGALLAVALGLVLWWAYFRSSAGPAEKHLERLTGDDRLTYAVLVYTYLHLSLILGIVLVAVGLEEAMGLVTRLEAFGPFGAGMLGGGVAVYLVGTSVMLRSSGAPWPRHRLIGALLSALAVPVLAVVPALAALAIITALTYGWVVAARRPRVH